MNSDDFIPLEPKTDFLQMFLKSNLEHTLSFPGKLRRSTLRVHLVIKTAFIPIIGLLEHLLISVNFFI